MSVQHGSRMKRRICDIASERSRRRRGRPPAVRRGRTGADPGGRGGAAARRLGLRGGSPRGLDADRPHGRAGGGAGGRRPRRDRATRRPGGGGRRAPSTRSSASRRSARRRRRRCAGRWLGISGCRPARCGSRRRRSGSAGWRGTWRREVRPSDPTPARRLRLGAAAGGASERPGEASSAHQARNRPRPRRRAARPAARRPLREPDGRARPADVRGARHAGRRRAVAFLEPRTSNGSATKRHRPHDAPHGHRARGRRRSGRPIATPSSRFGNERNESARPLRPAPRGGRDAVSAPRGGRDAVSAPWRGRGGRSSAGTRSGRARRSRACPASRAVRRSGSRPSPDRRSATCRSAR